ncbi:tellurite resistance TerB family protein [Chelatococcus asaccharovorans]|uniref:tellurite resistance TerB family protein n=1 Tax=Chelatococcus asaccharovorans TaxID=28210 RepID=UPI00224C6D8C|nr:DUF533 domain-containing protein [Chelatococcus asaccharovorans]CAH1648801.1 conserved hypothetical protein [Chelatococcus asaccharovorans]CAH1687367.1 conserved hypothetical protein [Chelatococcus asaccharovorans]
MFDAKKLLDVLVASASSQGPQGSAKAPAAGQSATGGPSSADLGPDATSGLGGLLGSVLSQLGGAGQPTQAGPAGSSSGIPGLPGASGTPNVGDLVTKARDFLQSPAGQNAASAVMGGLAGLLLGSKSGRKVATSAAKIGGLGLIAALAYKAYQGWQSGQPASSEATASVPALPVPSGTAFDASVASQDTALVLVRAMIAAAASDGHIDPEERGRIVGGLQQAGFDMEASQFLDKEFSNPASITTLAAAATTPEIGTQIYAAARLAIDPDTPAEAGFLKELSEALALDPSLVAHLDTAATSVKV